MRRITILVGLVFSVLAGCVQPDPTSTPNIEATVTALVATQVAELVAPSPDAVATATATTTEYDQQGLRWTLFSSTDTIPATYEELLAAATNAIEEILTEGVTLTYITLTETSADFTASAETVDQAIVFVETLRAAGRFGTVPFPRPVTEISASLKLGALPEALRIAIAAVPTPTPTPSGSIQDLAYIRTWAWAYTDDADPEFDGIDIYLDFLDSKSEQVQFSGVPIHVTVELYWDTNSPPIYREQVTISSSRGISGHLMRIPFGDIERRPSNITGAPIVEVRVTTLTQGEFTDRPGIMSFWFPAPTPSGTPVSPALPTPTIWAPTMAEILRCLALGGELMPWGECRIPPTPTPWYSFP